MSPERFRRHALIAAAAVLALLVAYAAFAQLLCGLLAGADWCAAWPRFTMAEIERYIKEAGPWGVAVSIGLMVLHSFVPFPAEFIAMANGMLYGVFWGTAITWSGAMLGAYLAFGLSRRLGRGFVRRVLEKKHALAVEKWSEHHGGGALFVMRFIPVISFNLINYAAGLTAVSWWTFTWATALGILPITVLMVVMGSRMATMPWYGWLLFIAAGAAIWGAGHLLRARLFKGK
ncbi:MAG: TVP38/TMEM64 family protein [Nitrospirota bacterium]